MVQVHIFTGLKRIQLKLNLKKGKTEREREENRQSGVQTLRPIDQLYICTYICINQCNRCAIIHEGVVNIRLTHFIYII